MILFKTLTCYSTPKNLKTYSLTTNQSSYFSILNTRHLFALNLLCIHFDTNLIPSVHILGSCIFSYSMPSCTKLLPFAQIRYLSHINPNTSCFLGPTYKKHSKIELRHADYNKTPLVQQHYEPSQQQPHVSNIANSVYSSHTASTLYWKCALTSQSTSTCNYSAHNTVQDVMQ